MAKPALAQTALAALADSFNQMARSLEDQERERRELILNFAHELRTPLTNLHGCLAAMREGVMAAGGAVFTILQDEIDRLRRLSNSLDSLAAGGGPPNRTSKRSTWSP